MQTRPAGIPPQDTRLMLDNGIVIRLGAGTVSHPDGRICFLTSAEIRVLRILVDARGCFVPVEAFECRADGVYYAPQKMYGLRSKIGKNAAKYLQSRRYLGYRLANCRVTYP